MFQEQTKAHGSKAAGNARGKISVVRYKYVYRKGSQSIRYTYTNNNHRYNSKIELKYMYKEANICFYTTDQTQTECCTVDTFSSLTTLVL